MPVEDNNGVIAGLDPTWPLANDPKSQGDNHIRNMKAMLQTQFPGALGEGLAIPLEASEAEFNFLVGVTSSIQAQINALTSPEIWQLPVAMGRYNALGPGIIGTQHGIDNYQIVNDTVYVTLDFAIPLDEQRIFISFQDPIVAPAYVSYITKLNTSQFIISSRYTQTNALILPPTFDCAVYRGA
jgi:hypothetical protein